MIVQKVQKDDPGSADIRNLPARCSHDGISSNRTEYALSDPPWISPFHELLHQEKYTIQEKE